MEPVQENQQPQVYMRTCLIPESELHQLWAAEKEASLKAKGRKKMSKIEQQSIEDRLKTYAFDPKELQLLTKQQVMEDIQKKFALVPLNIWNVILAINPGLVQEMKELLAPKPQEPIEAIKVEGKGKEEEQVDEVLDEAADDLSKSTAEIVLQNE